MCERCKARGWDSERFYCLEEGRSSSMNIPSPPPAADNQRESFIPIDSKYTFSVERGVALSKLLLYEKGNPLSLVLRIKPEALAKHPEILKICRAAKVRLEVIHENEERAP